MVIKKTPAAASRPRRAAALGRGADAGIGVAAETVAAAERGDTRATPAAGAAASPLATRLRALRRARGWTLERLAQSSGLARSTLSKIENGRLSPTYDALLKLAAGLGVDVAELFAAPHGPIGIGRRSVTRRGEGQPHVTPSYAHELLCADLAHKQMMPFVTTIRARVGDHAGGWSRHDGEEFVYVLSGEIELQSECYRPVRLAAGDSFYLDSRMGHRVLGVGTEDARVLWVSTSRGHVPREEPAGDGLSGHHE